MKPPKPWRKLWRAEPSPRISGLSFQARALLTFLIRYAEDNGQIGRAPDPLKRLHPGSVLRGLLAIPDDRRSLRIFYKTIDELLAYGNDGEPGCLVIQDGFLTLTGFEICQANRTTSRQQLANISPTTRQHLANISPPTLNLSPRNHPTPDQT
jgi:hypothetical protein